MADLPGYQRLGGSSRRVRTPAGDTISRRQYENLKAQRSGFANWHQWQQLRRDDQYQRWLKQYAKNRGISTTKARDPASEFNKGYMKAKKAGFKRSARGDFSKFLVQLGYRDSMWQFDVGDTPGVQK